VLTYAISGNVVGLRGRVGEFGEAEYAASNSDQAYSKIGRLMMGGKG